MKYKRNRTQSLTIRLTPTEKKMLRRLADSKHMSMTDYILISALNQSDAVLYSPLLKKLSEVKEKLIEANDSDEADIYDALKLYEKVYCEIMSAIGKR